VSATRRSQRFSRCAWAVFRADKAGVYHGLARIVLFLRGACMSIREVRVEL